VALADTGFDGAVVLITGGASGIGRAAARRLAGQGAHVVIADLDEEAGREVAGALDGTFVRCDVTRPGDSVGAVSVAESTYGRLDIALLNAGIQGGGPVDEDFDVDAYRRVMAVNADGVAYGLAAALPTLAQHGGAAVCTASLAGLTGVPADPAYAMSKHAVVGLVRSVAEAWAGRGVIVNAVCPGFADTPLVEGLREQIAAFGVPLITPDAVDDGIVAAALSPDPGQCWIVQVGREPLTYGFRGIPGPRVES
jgi:NAD(P)-dependent dehydrogenase (short-subunit alcohol dehydrogenase family)